MHTAPLSHLQPLPPKSTSTPFPSPKPNHHVHPPLSFRSPPSSSKPRRLHIFPARCSGEEPPRARDEELSDMVGELLRRKENRALLDGLTSASRRVDLARAALADIERQEAQILLAKDQIRQLQSRSSEIEESQRELSEARAMVDEAQRSLSSNTNEDSGGDELKDDDKERERFESIKAGIVSSVVGLLAGLPISLYQASAIAPLMLHLAGIFVGCALFGVTFRYTIRRDLDNFQLKTGTCAAFGIVKGLAMLEAGKTLEYNIGDFVSYSVDDATSVAESLFVFLFSAIALDFCFKMRLLSPFPIRK